MSKRDNLLHLKKDNNNDDSTLPTPEYEIVTFADLEPDFTEPTFLHYPLLPRREVTLMDGNDGVGKTWAILAIAAGLTGSKSCPTPYDHTATKKARVMILTSEDDPNTTVGPRLKRLGANLRNVAIIAPKEAEFVNGITVSELEGAKSLIINFKPDLIIVDHLTLYSSSDGKIDTHRDTHARSLMDGLKNLAKILNCAVLVARHIRKDGGSAKDSGLGSVAFRAASRSHLVIGHDPYDESKTRRIIKQVKMNLAPKLEKGLVYTLEQDNEPPFQWEGLSDVSEDLLTDKKAREQASSEMSKKESAIELLHEFLDDGSEVEMEVILKTAGREGISKSTLYSAAKELEVVKKQPGAGGNKKAVWSLPK